MPDFKKTMWQEGNRLPLHSKEWFLSLYDHIEMLKEMEEEKLVESYMMIWHQAHYIVRGGGNPDSGLKGKLAPKYTIFLKEKIPGYSNPSGCLISIIFPMIVILMILMVS